MSAPSTTRPIARTVCDEPLTLLARVVFAGDLLDKALDKLRTCHLALAPDNRGWHDEDSMLAVWSILEDIIRDSEPVRNRLQGNEGTAA